MAVLTASPTLLPSARPQPNQGAAPRDAGEPIMAIRVIKSQKVTIYDVDGWVLRAPVSSGNDGTRDASRVFSVVQKDKDHRSNLL